MEPTSVANEVAIVAIKVLATALAAIAAIYLPKIFAAIERRIGVDIPDPIEREAQRLADRAINRAEELGRKHAQKLNDALPHNLKLEKAATYFREHARKRVISWLSDKVEDYLEERLGARRAGPVPDWVDGDPAGGDAGDNG
jgi:hypothetical protein